MVERHVAAASVGGVGAEDCFGLSQLDSLGNGAGAEAGEDHEVNGTDPGAGKHQGDRLEVGGHVDGDAVASLDANGSQRCGHPLDLLEQLRVGVDPLTAVLIQCDQGGASAVAVVDLDVEAGVGEIGLAADEPAEGGNLLRGPFKDLVPLAEPGNPCSGFGPEGVRLIQRAALDFSDDRTNQINVRRHVPTPNSGLD